MTSDGIVHVVDDDESVRSGIANLLQSVGIDVETYASTAEFMRSMRRDLPSCLVLDVRLPGLSGLDLQVELTKTNFDIPIIFITGHGDIPMTVRAMKAGAIEFLTKPFREQDLLDAVRVGLDRDRTRRKDKAANTELQRRYESLSPREKAILALITSGKMNKQVAAEIGISEVTVKVHRHNVMAKMGAKSLAELVRMAGSLNIRL
jgi:FixJ family two-component response regulator